MPSGYGITLDNEQLLEEYNLKLKSLQDIEGCLIKSYKYRDELNSIRRIVERKFPLQCRGKENWSTKDLVFYILNPIGD